MADVAKVAGVHTTTVSLALRNHPSIPSATCARIQAIADRMGYRPDPAISALMARRRSGRKRRENSPLAYLTNRQTEFGWKESPAHAQFYDGAVERADRLGYRVEHFWMGEPGLTGRRLAQILTTRGITGVITASHERGNAVSSDFDWRPFSAVKIDHYPAEPQLHVVTNNQRAIAQLAITKALEAGYQRIGMVMPEWWDACVDLAWSAGFLCMERSIPEERRVPILEYDSVVGVGVPLEMFGQWYRRHRPDVIISYAPFVESALRALSLRVPEDVGYVEIFLTDESGGVAGVRQNCRRVGEAAVEILVGQLLQNVRGLPEFPAATLIEGSWIDGRSLPSRRGCKRVAAASSPAAAS